MDDMLNKIENQRLKERAKKIREHCVRVLPRIHSQGLFRYYNDHGPAHSEAILRLLNNLLDNILLKKDNGRLTEYDYFLLYTAAWCHDLGMLMKEGEDFDNSKVCERVRETHPERTAEYLRKNWREMGIQSEIEAFFLEQICEAHGGNSKKIKELPEEQPIVLDGERQNIHLCLLGALIRLADALDAREDRLPPEPYMEVLGIPEKQYVEYWKHGVVHSVSINHREKKNSGSTDCEV
ncbi:MAG: HD domain-containing protein [archaeon]|nr:HD domain-containing protein [archaeon]